MDFKWIIIHLNDFNGLCFYKNNGYKDKMIDFVV